MTTTALNTNRDKELGSDSQSIHCTLFDLQKHQSALIIDIIENDRFGALDTIVSQRLKDLGFLPNTPIRIVAKGLFGRSPYAVQLGSGIQFSLRTDELIKIRCRILN